MEAFVIFEILESYVRLFKRCFCCYSYIYFLEREDTSVDRRNNEKNLTLWGTEPIVIKPWIYHVVHLSVFGRRRHMVLGVVKVVAVDLGGRVGVLCFVLVSDPVVIRGFLRGFFIRCARRIGLEMKGVHDNGRKELFLMT